MGGIVHEWVSAHLITAIIWNMIAWICFTAFVYIKALVFQREVVKTERRSVYIETSHASGTVSNSIASEAFQITKVLSCLFLMLEVLLLVAILV